MRFRGMGGNEGAGTVAGMPVPIYIVRWLEDHKNRLYGFMGLRSKMLGDWTGLDEWMDTLDCYDY